MPYKDPEKQKKYQAKWYQKNKPRISKKEKEKYDPRKKRNYRLLQDHDITVDQYDAQMESQGNCCAICGLPGDQDQMSKSMPIDHNHETGEYRDIICSHCNTALGLVKDNIETLKKMIAYLRKHQV